MDVLGSMAVKTLEQAMPGELVRLLVKSTVCFAIVLAKFGRDTLLGVLQPIADLVDSPSYTHRESNARCVSYGSDWMIEPCPDAEFRPGSNQNLADKSGVLHLDGTSWVICFQPSPTAGAHSEIYFDLNDNGIVGYPAHGAPVAKWKLWRSAEAYSIARAEPLLEIDESHASI
jgi:hypothetical protein